MLVELDLGTVIAAGGLTTAVVGSLGGIIVRSINGRIKAVEDNVGTKADKEVVSTSVANMRDDIGLLWQENKELRKDFNGGLEAIRKEMNAAHLDIVERIGKMNSAR